MVSIFTYDFAVATQAFEKASLRYHALTRYPTLIELAREKGLVSSEQEPILLKWRDDPASWTGVQ